MSNFIMGVIWTAFMAIFTWLLYFATGGNLFINSQGITQQELNDLLFMRIFIGIFWTVGIVLMFCGLKSIIRNLKINKNGVECFGKIIKIYPSGIYIDGRPEIKADFAVYMLEGNKVKIFSKIIGLDKSKFSKGTWCKLKQFESDINILEVALESEIPLDIVDVINNLYSDELYGID